MAGLIEVILPVFLVIGFGYLARWRSWIGDSGVDGLMRFATNFAVPVLLFTAIARLDLSQTFDLGLLFSFYASATLCFLVGIFGARLFFRRGWEDAIAIGFCCLFSNSLMLGLPISERAYGTESLGPNFAIVAIHAPFCYCLGILVMEVVRGQGTGALATSRAVLTAMFRNAIVLGIAAGFAVNLTGLPIPAVVGEALSLLSQAALPAALFGLGGVLYRYRPEGDLRTILFVCAVSLVLHPVLVWGLGRAVDLPEGAFRAAVLTAAMAPGANAYLFADLYGRARRVAASSVLLGTAFTIFTAWFWLAALG